MKAIYQQVEKIDGIYDVLHLPPALSTTELLFRVSIILLITAPIIIWSGKLYFSRKNVAIRSIRKSLHKYRKNQISQKEFAFIITREIQASCKLVKLDKNVILHDKLVQHNTNWNQLCESLAKVKYKGSETKIDFDKTYRQAIFWIRKWK